MTDTIKPSTRNITAIFRAATDADRTESRQWYRQARALAEELAAKYPRDVDAAAAVIAVLSPRLSWPKNVELAWRVFDLYFAGVSKGEILADWPGIKVNANKALRILAGETPDDVVGGPKVRSFWFTIVDPTDPRTVVIDRHAFDVAANRPLTDEVRGRLLGRRGAYDSVAELYRRAAKILSAEFGTITPAEVQAVTWTYWRRERAAAYHKGA